MVDVFNRLPSHAKLQQIFSYKEHKLLPNLITRLTSGVSNKYIHDSNPRSPNYRFIKQNKKKKHILLNHFPQTILQLQENTLTQLLGPMPGSKSLKWTHSYWKRQMLGQ